MKQVFMQGGKAVVQQVPAPQMSPKNILVRVAHSCISVGTEVAGVKLSGLPLYRRALKQPHHVKRVLQVMRDQGIKRTFQRVTGQLAAGIPSGYSASGRVLEVGSEVEMFQIGDLVACAGAGIANHAEMIDVPVNLAVKLPDGLGTLEGSSVAIGSIAMQGIRRANLTLGGNGRGDRTRLSRTDHGSTGVRQWLPSDRRGPRSESRPTRLGEWHGLWYSPGRRRFC